MLLPSNLKFQNIFVDGQALGDQIDDVTLPELGRKMEDWRGGGMDGDVEIDLGQEKIVVKHKYGGNQSDMIRGFGSPTLDGVQIRWAGSHERGGGEIDAVEVVVRGRHKKITRDARKSGKLSTTEVETTCVYYKETLNGEDLIEIDLLGMVFKVGGVDRLAQHRANINR